MSRYWGSLHTIMVTVLTKDFVNIDNQIFGLVFVPCVQKAEDAEGNTRAALKAGPTTGLRTSRSGRYGQETLNGKMAPLHVGNCAIFVLKPSGPLPTEHFQYFMKGERIIFWNSWRSIITTQRFVSAHQSTPAISNFRVNRAVVNHYNYVALQ